MKNSPAAGLKLDMAAYIIDAAVCPSLQAALLQSTSGCACFFSPFYRIRRRIVDSLTGKKANVSCVRLFALAAPLRECGISGQCGRPEKSVPERIAGSSDHIGAGGAALCERLAAAHRRFEQPADACAAFRGAFARARKRDVVRQGL